MKVFFSIVSVLLVLIGSVWLLFPEAILGSWSVQSDATGVYMSRRHGSLFFGYATILWLGRSAGPSAGRTAILGGGALVTALLGLVSLWGVVSGTIGPLAWTAVMTEAVLSGGFSYFLLAERTQRPAKASS